MSDPTPDSGGYQLAYEEAKRALEDQERSVTELRSRAGQLLAAAAVTTSFFGGRALGAHPGWAAWTATGCFVAVALAVLALLYPVARRDWEFSLSAASLIASYLEPADGFAPVDLPGIHRDLALHMDDSRERNQVQLGQRYTLFRVGAVLLATEVIFWVIALINQR